MSFLQPFPSLFVVTETQINPVKRAIFWSILLGIPFLLLITVEVALRVAGYGESYPLFLPIEEIDGYKIPNPDLARRYFGNASVVPTISQDSFLSSKPDSSFRIFVQGGSTAAGFPYYYDASPGDVLENLLQNAYGRTDIQVITTATSAVNSYTLLDIADEIIAEEPDAIVIYAGHNEFYGAMGVASTTSLGNSIRLKRLYLRVRHFRVVQILQSFISRLTSKSPDEVTRKGTLMARMVGEQSVIRGSPTYEAGLRQFESNMSLLLRKYERHGIPVFISTIVSNERGHQPFIGEPAAEVLSDWQSLRKESERVFAEGDSLKSEQLLRRGLDLDTLAADPHFVLGERLLTLRKVGAAREQFLLAKEKDRLRFRAPEQINTIIGNLSEKHGAVLVDAQERIARNSEYGIPGNDLITEHLHPNLDGYRFIAQAFLDAFLNSDLLNDEEMSGEQSKVTNYPSELDSLLGDFRIIQITASWPFKPNGSVERPIDELVPSNQLEDIAKRVFLNETDRIVALNELLVAYQAVGQINKAISILRNSADRYLFLESAQRATGAILAASRRQEEALPYFLNAYSIEERPESARMIGSILLNAGQDSEAVGYLQRSLELGDQTEQSFYNLALAYFRLKEYDEALGAVNELLKRWPQHSEGQRLKAAINRG